MSWYDDVSEQDEVEGVVTLCPRCGRHYLPAPCPDPALAAVHYGRVYVAPGTVMGVALCGAKSPDAPGSVGLLYSSSWDLVDCAGCLAQRPPA